MLKRIQKVLKPVMVPINPAGYPFIILFIVGTAILWWIADFLGFVGLVLVFWCIYFFRDPVRHVPQGEGLIISPADGVVAEVREVDVPDEITLPYARAIRVGVFMNVFDVHVNRAPCAGKVTYLGYYPGSFFDASLDKASVQNERQLVVLETAINDAEQKPISLAFVQIAGLVARRIICDLNEGEMLDVGQRFGLIRFGSRVDVYLPVESTVTVSVGQRMLAGQTVLGSLTNLPEKGWPSAKAQ